jgi:PTS system nitrogen regulatory IIA component
MGVAIPHAKLKDLSRFFIVIGIVRPPVKADGGGAQSKGLEWMSLDKAPVRLVFMIGGPEGKQTEYLQILSLLTSAVREVDLRKKLLSARNPGEVLQLFSDF